MATLFSDLMCLLSGPRNDEVPSTDARSRDIPATCVYPITKSQEGIWIECQSDPATTKYNLTLEWDLLKEDSREYSFSDILQVISKLNHRYAILRSTTALIDGRPHVREHAPETVDPEVRVVYRESRTVTNAEMKKQLRRPFDLVNEAPARWVILKDPKVFRVYLVAHHVVVDGASMSLISGEFLEVLRNPECSLPPLADFSRMHMLEKAWSSSQTYLDNRETVLAQVRGKNNGYWNKEHVVAKPKAGQDYRIIDPWTTFQKSELEGWSNSYKTSWFRVAVSLVGLLVVDKTRPKLGLDEVLSVAFGGRPKEMNTCVGNFVNLLPVKIPVWQALGKSDRSFKSLVSAVSKNLSSIKKAELFPPVEVARECRKQNIDYQTPRVAVTYSPKLAKSECRLFPVEGNWDLLFCFLEYDDDVKLGVSYDPQVFSAATVGAMKTQFEELIRLSQVEEVKLNDMLDWLPLYPSLPRAVSDGPNKHLHHWIDAHALTSPNSVAFSSHELGISVTYGELYASTERKAKNLIQRGLGREDRVMLNLQQGPAAIDWMIAVMKSGAAFVYLDPNFAEGHKTRVINNCKPALIIDQVLANSIAESDSANQDESFMQAELLDIKNSTRDEDLAYMMYTSGSTGVPKGVMIEHGSIASYIAGISDILDLGYGARCLQWAPLYFDGTFVEWAGALCTGGTVCFPQWPKHLIGEYLADVLEQNDVTLLQATPTAIATMPTSREYATLRQIIMTGEPPSADHFRRFSNRLSVVNGYGPTETTVEVLFKPFNKGDAIPDRLPCGKPTPRTTAYICNEEFTAVLKPGADGELCIAGPQLARGYCEQDDLTVKKFAMHPNGTRMYRTGDKARIDENGDVLIVGRIDRELKVRGQRIAPEEVESTIINTGMNIYEASVQKSEDGMELVAAVAPEGADINALRATLRGILPNYKIPSKFVSVNTLPKNVNGKIDHKAITQMFTKEWKTAGVVEAKTETIKIRLPEDSTEEEEQFTEEETDEEEEEETDDTADEEDVGSTIMRLWQETLDTTELLPTNVNFFDLGGHSLLVPKLFGKLRAAFPETTARLSDLFHQSNIERQTILFGGSNAPQQKKKQDKKKVQKKKKKTSAKKVSTRKLAVHDAYHTKPSLSKSSSVSALRSALATPAPGTETPLTVASDEEDATGTAPAVAIVGIAGRFPMAKSADEFFDNLVSGTAGITDSGIRKEVMDGNVWVSKAGFLQDVEDFDHEFWNMSREEATETDPQQRLFLEVAHEALTDAGEDFKTTMDGRRVGLFVGAANPSYHLHTESVASDPFSRENRAGIQPSISARTAYQLNISGPNVTISTHCASSTVALSQAYDSIRTGRCDMAVVGGVAIQHLAGGYVTGPGQIFSARGECNPYDARADGTVPSDAVTAVVLRKYADAAARGTPVYARILGSGIGSDGNLEKAGFQVPSPRGQAEVIKAAYKLANMSPRNLKYSEMHGSGTPVGDALEMEGIALAVKELGGTPAPFTIGSVKGNVGNTQHASGLVSLIKVCKSMQRGVIPAIKGLETPSDMIDPALPVRLAREETRLERTDVLGVSASGWGGVNSHTILGFPDEHLQKRETRRLPEGTFKRVTLAAPRIAN